jgi:hypothetical protein
MVSAAKSTYELIIWLNCSGVTSPINETKKEATKNRTKALPIKNAKVKTQAAGMRQ